MKALTVHPLYAELITSGVKTIECRTWKTEYRGDILITSNQKKMLDTIPGHALAIAELYDIHAMSEADAQAAFMKPQDCTPDKYAWMLRNVRLIEPIAVKGHLSLWNFDEDEKIKVIMTVDELFSLPQDEFDAICNKYWEHFYV